ncbi:hypothetical protein MTR65_03110 [Novosphingobium sp. 2637]|uniref:Uncharacterized protein n=1 Tax=Novosphingobium mangrovi (ex Hu et al. 2023) TaxID=2930094 RepID=A0ABT0A8Z7_9SPHN|nr:hypothetical protein [Novosphingobium mangrovi (ex Hu et al. 2023)]MCJ1959670.1 hypothetical protein [Novosphingobium mangrovi (ex Hu et al. 2023)]
MAPGGHAGLDEPLHAALDLLCVPFAEHLAHQAAEGDTHGVSVAAVVDTVDGDVLELRDLVELGNVGDVAREAVHGLGHDQVELALEVPGVLRRLRFMRRSFRFEQSPD